MSIFSKDNTLEAVNDKEKGTDRSTPRNEGRIAVAGIDVPEGLRFFCGAPLAFGRLVSKK